MGRPRKKGLNLPQCVHEKHGALYYVKGGKWTFLGRGMVAGLRAYAERFEAPPHGLDGLIDRTLESLRPSIAPNTLRQYQSVSKRLKHLLREFSHPREVSSGDIVDMRKGMYDTPSMANHFLSFARQVFNLALEERSIESNPVLGVKRMKEHKRGRLLSQIELDRIYAASDEQLQVIEDLLCLTGQRVVATLQIRLADLTDAGIRFPKFKTDTKRIVKWTPELAAVVERAKALRGNVRSMIYLLQEADGKPPAYRTVKRRFDAACKAAGVDDAQMRDFRAVAATTVEEQGGNAQKLLGHTSPSHTARYLRGKREPVVEGPSFRRLIDSDGKKR
jgi:integrase